MPKMVILRRTDCNCCGMDMKMDESGEFWYCALNEGGCGSEFWIKYRQPSENKQIREAFENQYVSQSLQPGYIIPPGGSKSTGKKRKKEKGRMPSRKFDSLYRQT